MWPLSNRRALYCFHFWSVEQRRASYCCNFWSKKPTTVLHFWQSSSGALHTVVTCGKIVTSVLQFVNRAAVRLIRLSHWNSKWQPFYMFWQSGGGTVNIVVIFENRWRLFLNLTIEQPSCFMLFSFLKYRAAAHFIRLSFLKHKADDCPTPLTIEQRCASYRS